MKVTQVTRVVSTSTAEGLEVVVTVARIGAEFEDSRPDVADLPPDFRAALAEWLRAGLT